MESQKIAFILFLCIVAGNSIKQNNSIKYDNFSLFMGIPNTEEELDFYKMLTDEYNVLYWKKPGKLYSSVEFSIGPSQLETFLLDVYRKKISLSVVTKDLQSFFEKQRINHYTKWQLSTFDWTGYYRLEDIYNWLEDLQKTNPEVISLVKLGSTLEKKWIMGVNVRFQQNRPKVIIEGGIHAREWISPAFVTYMINVVVNAPSSQNKILQDMIVAYDWIFVPVVNPDGYEYTHRYDRLWNKNRRHSHGVDLNKNFDAVFGTVGVNQQRFGDSYCGEAEFSEPESKAMGDMITANHKDLRYYIAFHSFGQNFIIPSEFSDQYMDNYKEVKQLGKKVVEQIKRRFDTEYSVGTTYDLKGYIVSGTSTSWVKKTFKIPYVATFELRDTGMNGFALPAQEILPTCLETMDGVCAFLGYSGCILGPDKKTKTKLATAEKLSSIGHLVSPRMFLILLCFLLSL